MLKYDSVLKAVNGSSPSSDFYSVSHILNALDDFYNLLKEKQEPEYVYFNEFRQDVFESVFKSYMKPQESAFSKVCPSDLNRFASQVFGTIKAKLDFFDDEPVTAYLRLKDKTIRVYISNARTNPSMYKKSTVKKSQR